MGATLRIGRLSTEYLIPSACPDPTRIRDRLGEGLERSLVEALRSILQYRLDSGPDVWMISRVEVEVDVGAHWDADRLARALAEAVTQALSTRLQTESEHSVHFPDRAAHLARFLLDLSRGQAWSRWYYRAYEGLRMLPVSAALRSALTARGAPALPALLSLTDGERETVLKALNEQDAQRVLEALRDLGAVEAGDALDALWAVWRERALVEVGTESRWRSALGLAVAAAGVSPAGTACVPGALALTLLSFGALIASASRERAERVVAALLHSDTSALYIAVGASEAERLQPLRQIPSVRLCPVLQGLLERHGHAPSAKEASPKRAGLAEGGEPRHTPFGGLLILLPLLEALPIRRITRDWLGAEGVAAADLLRYLLLVRCAGRERALAAFSDPLLRDLLGMPPGISATEAGDWQRGLGAHRLDVLLTELAEHRRRRGDTDENDLYLLSLPNRGDPVVLLIEGRRGTWLDACTRAEVAPLVEALRPRLADEARVLTTGPLVDGLRRAFPRLWVRDYQAEEGASERLEVQALLARAEQDLDFFRLPAPLAGGRGVELALSVAAQGLMRDLAWRLPGFAGSTLPYLYANFLDFRASLEVEPDKYLARLGRPPVNVVLAITGLARGTHRISGLDRPLVLFQGD